MSAAPTTAAEATAARERGRLVETRGLTKLYRVDVGFLAKKKALLSAVEDLDLAIARGETLGLVGESGSGKSTVARLLIRLVEPTRGEIRYDGRDVLTLSARELRRLRRRIQIVFQDPYSSLNPRHSVGRIISEGIQTGNGRRSRAARVRELLDLVGLTSDVLERYPHEFSGGQRQRICIARALAVGPEFLILDEPVSALDVSIQSKILNLLHDLKRQLNLTYLFISHDLSVVHHIADRVAVMYLGHLVELAPKSALYGNPLHPYTQALLSAVPSTSKRSDANGRVRLSGEIPSPIDIPRRCRFATRCPRSIERSWHEVPPLERAEREHYVACFNWAPLERDRSG
jgi:peptide/nickel transport system ATP-binding protein/oligopeptide transport system ATP-binding protein